MKSSWPIRTLSEVCQNRPPKSEARKVLKDDDLVSFVPMNDLPIREKRLNLTGESPLGKVYGGYTYFAEGDVLLAKITPCFENGKLGIARGLKNGVGFGSSEFFVLRANESVIPEFLFYFLCQDSVRDSGKRVMSGAVGHKRVPKEFIEQLPLPLPTPYEQKCIVAILDEAFAGIETAIANTEKNLANAGELFSSFLATLLADSGKDWRFLTLKEICSDYGRGKSKHRPRNDPMLYGGSYPFIQTGDVRRSDHKITSYTATYNENGLEQSKLWPKGTICITIAANIAETGILDFDACFPDSIIGLVVDESKASREYVEFLLQSLKAVLKAKGKGSAQDNINLGTFESETFPFPPLEIQNDIVQRADELRKSVRQLECVCIRKLEAFEELEQSLLQKAFSGELTADRAEEEAESATA